MAEETSKPNPADTFYKVGSLNKWFLISSLVLTLTYIWSVVDDYSRTWKGYQRDFLRVEHDLANRQAKDVWDTLGGKSVNDRMTDLFDRLDRARAVLAADHEKRPELQNAVDAAQLHFNLTNAAMKKAKAEFEADRFHYEEHAHEAQEVDIWNPESEAIRSALTGYLQLRSHYEDLAEQDKQAEEALNQAKKDLGDYDSLVTVVQAEMDELDREISRLERKRDSVDPKRFFTTFRNAIFVDFMAPNIKGQKIVVKEIFDELNFKQVPKVDMCISCHLATDRFRDYGAASPEAEKVDPVFRSHSQPELFCTSLSPHPQDRFGCSGCHGGNGQRMDFGLAFHAPSDPEEEARWKKDYHWHEPHYWDYPMVATGFLQSSCYKCHDAQVSINGAPEWNRGRNLVEHFGCYGCHKIQPFERHRKVGPPLYHLLSKLKSPEFALKWVENPTDFREKARMPRFFHLPNKADQPERQRAEIAAIVQYVYNLSTPTNLKKYPGNGNAERGKVLFGGDGGIACLGCHTMDDFDPAKFSNPVTFEEPSHGPDLSGIGSKVSADWLFTWLLDPKSMWAETNMPNLRLTEEQAADLVAYLSTKHNVAFEQKVFERPRDDQHYEAILEEKLSERMTLDRARAEIAAMSSLDKMDRAGGFLVNHYGCSGCHLIAGHENDKQIGTELNGWGSKHADRLDFGVFEMDWKHEGMFNRERWLDQKLTDTRFFDKGKDRKAFEQLKMPQFPFDDGERKAIMTFVLGLTKEPFASSIKKHLSEAEQAVERGHQIVRNKNCLGCHELYKEGGRLRQILTGMLGDEGGAKFHPPLLNGQGGRTQSSWLFAFLKDPSMGRGRGAKNYLRPWLKARMPTFEFSQQELNDLLAFFAHQEVYLTSEDRALWKKQATKFALDFPGYGEDELRKADAVRYNLHQALVGRQYRAQGGKYLGSTDFPYVVGIGRPMSEAELDQARELFVFLKCVLCHDPSGVPPQGKTEADLAPNLAYTRDRLQPKWLGHWLRGPSEYQPGTRMPNFWPMNEETGVRDSVSDRINDAEKEADLIRDYLFSERFAQDLQDLIKGGT